MGASDCSWFPIVEHVLLAEFDIDKGSSLTHQYPSPTTANENCLAELMLPDGAHLREQDWTIFLLNQPKSGNEDNVEKSPFPVRSASLGKINAFRTIEAFGFIFDSVEYMWKKLSKGYSKIKIILEDDHIVFEDTEGITIKELNDITSFQHRRVDHLEHLILHKDVIYGIMFVKSAHERLFVLHLNSLQVLNTAYDSRLYRLNILHPSPETSFSSNDRPKDSLQYVLNLVQTKRDPDVRRGATVKALAISSRYPWIHVFKPLLLLGLERYSNNPVISEIGKIYDAINAMNMKGVPLLSIAEKTILRNSESGDVFQNRFGKILQAGMKATASAKTESRLTKDFYCHETCIYYDNVRIPVKIPLIQLPSEISDYSISKLVSTFSGSTITHNGLLLPELFTLGPQTTPMIVLINALLLEKRILFIGHGKSANEITNYVLAACSIGSGGNILRAFNERCFPYTCLSCIDELLKCQGYIAGVANPTFESHTNWWDLLFNINNGKVTVSPDIKSNSTLRRKSQGGGSGDDGQLSSYEYYFNQDVIEAVKGRLSEITIRKKFQNYISRFIQLAALYEVQNYGETNLGNVITSEITLETGEKQKIFKYGPYYPRDVYLKRELQVNSVRIEAWRKTSSYLVFQEDAQTFLVSRCIKDINPDYIISQLKNAIEVPEYEIESIFEQLNDQVYTEEQILEFLSHVSEDVGGLDPIAMGLLHNKTKIRELALRFLKHIEGNEVGKLFVKRMNDFLYQTFKRQLQQLKFLDEK